MANCSCGSALAFDNCCGPVLSGKHPAATAEALMRARYSAYVHKQIPFILETTHPNSRQDSDEAAMLAWAEQAEWQELEVVSTEAGQAEDSRGKVEFIARFSINGINQHHHELSHFVKEDGQWYFVDGGQTYHSGPSDKPKPVVNESKIGRNDPCLCGSGKKYKKCCGA